MDDSIGKKLDEYLTSITLIGFSGVIFVAKDKQILLSKGYGAANKKKAIPFSNKTVFDIGSITKQFTAAAILKLEMQDRLSVNDPISKYFADVPLDKSKITIHHLLTHSAGFIPILGEDYYPITRDEYIKLALNSLLINPAGDIFLYSNVGYSLLGAIIEIVTKQSYEQYLNENIFKPAGMTKTGYKIPEWKQEELAMGYTLNDEEWGTPLDKAWAQDGPYWNLCANGGILSTTEDLYRWHLALEGEEVLSKRAKEKLFKPQISRQAKPALLYGYGWFLNKTKRGTKLIWHSGGNNIFYAEFRRYIDEGIVVIVATNTAMYQASKEIEKLIELIFASVPNN